ncbi:MAG TPA: (d)CMP kinase [Longimicrobiales bacterium]|nr:(d)CMP kinase [Longimicrobiales bacterium]
MIVAIDGPAGSGKSTTAGEVARRLGYLHVDSGAFYRALTYALIQEGIPVDRWDGYTVEELDALEVRGERRDAHQSDDGAPAADVTIRVAGEVVDEELRSADVNACVSRVARIPAVRDWLLGRLRELAHSENVVVDGRDIGTVVFPDAGTKVFLVADPEVRARRRLAQQGVEEPGLDTLREEVERLRERDRQDSEREVAPLRVAEDAVVVDTTALTFEEQVTAILELARGRAAGAGAPVS